MIALAKESGGFLHEVMRILLLFIGRIITKHKSGQKDFLPVLGVNYLFYVS